MRADRTRPRAWCRLFSSWVVVVMLATGCSGDGPDRASPSRLGPEPTPASTAAAEADAPAQAEAHAHALTVLREWDTARAQALASEDVAGLRSLYRPGSGLGKQDVALLRRYGRRGLRITDAVHQTLRADVVVAAADLVEVTVVERLTGVQVVGDAGEERTLPTSRPAQRVLRFVRSRGPDDRWLLSSATGG